VRREYDRPIIGNLVEFVYKHGTEVAQSVDDEFVVDDLMAHIDRRPEPLERELDDLDRAVDSGAKPPRGGDEYAYRRAVQHADRHIRLRLQA
jgi:hypothetical protein